MQDSPLWLNLVVFALSGAAIWWAGTRLEHYTDVLAERTGLGHALAGMMLLAVATSLPEVATTITAVVVLDNPTLAVNNLLGGVALQTMLLGVADAVKRRRGALTFFSPDFALLVQGVGLVLLLIVAMTGITARGEPAVAGVSLWLVALLVTYLAVVYLVYRHRSDPRWTAAVPDDFGDESRQDAERSNEDQGPTTRRAALWFAGLSAVVLVSGWLTTQSAEAVADQTGLGSAFVGATLLALATSLPEVSTTITASRRGHYSVAFSNIFGSNAFTVTLLVVADALFRGGTILADADRSAAFVTMVGAAMTCFYVLGLLARGNRTVLRVGWDSAAAFVVYLASMGVLYTMR